MAINRVVLVGRMTRDPEMRKTSSDLSVVSFTLAVDDRPRKDGSAQTSFIPCQAWNKTAEIVCRYCHKGSLVAVEGRMSQRSYMAKDGSKKSSIEVVCDQVQFLDTRKSSGNDYSGSNGGYGESQSSNQAADAPIEGIDSSEDDTPF